MFQHWFTYYAAVGLFAAGMVFATLVSERDTLYLADWISIGLSAALWPLLVLYILIYDKYGR